MKKTKINRSAKYFITVIVAVKVGSFFTDMLYKTEINVWIARGVGCAICVGIGLAFIHLWIKDDKK